MEKSLYFISGLPRSGATMIAYILNQNPKIHSEPVSSLSGIFSSIWSAWNTYEPNVEFNNQQAKIGVLTSVLEGYYKHIDKPIVFDKDRTWVSKIGLIEAVTGKKVKILCPVRNPAEILASYEKIRRSNPLEFTRADQTLRETTNIAARAYFFSGPNGNLGVAHTAIRDAIIEGYLDRMLFIDYNRFCNSPRSQTKRIYDFFELPEFTHDFTNIEQTANFNDSATGLPGLHRIKPKLERTTVNPVEFLGLDLYQQYNREIFWDAWI